MTGEFHCRSPFGVTRRRSAASSRITQSFPIGNGQTTGTVIVGPVSPGSFSSPSGHSNRRPLGAIQKNAKLQRFLDERLDAATSLTTFLQAICTDLAERVWAAAVLAPGLSVGMPFADSTAPSLSC
jgi:hypothetical protein